MQVTADQIVYLIAIVAGIIGVPVINGIKSLLGAYGKYALAVASVLSVVLGAVVVWFSGMFVGSVFDLDTMINVSTEIFTVATILFKAMQADKPASQ